MLLSRTEVVLTCWFTLRVIILLFFPFSALPLQRMSQALLPFCLSSTSVGRTRGEGGRSVFLPLLQMASWSVAGISFVPAPWRRAAPLSILPPLLSLSYQAALVSSPTRFKFPSFEIPLTVTSIFWMDANSGVVRCAPLHPDFLSSFLSSHHLSEYRTGLCLLHCFDVCRGIFWFFT